jgi:trehalose 6-phosphate synthase
MAKCRCGVPRDLARSCDLLIVSNRTPLTEGGRTREVGGLVSAVHPVIERRGGVWLGWNGHEREPGLTLSVERDGRGRRATFDYPVGWRESFYSGFCNQSLWPLLHCFPGRVRYVDEEWVAYVAANEAYARLAAQIAAPTGTVWIHDFHLMLTGSALRHLGHQGPLGFFLHVPFPPRDVWETLPWSDEVIEAMLSFDLIGFHTARWAENFLSAASRHCVTSGGRTLMRRGRKARVGVFPMGVETAAFAPDDGSAIPADVEGLRAVLGDRKLLLGVDRLDYSKGIPERLEAFRRLLEVHPEWRSKVSFVQISVPSRADVPEYALLRRRVEELVGRINGEFGEADWLPVRYLYRSYEPASLAHLYRLADVAVVTPLRDGMNLVAKEFVAAQLPSNPGVLVLSKFAGAAEELQSAILTNPFHTDGMAADLDRALRLGPQERRRRHAEMSAAMSGTGAAAWADAFLDQLDVTARDAAAHEVS